MTKERIESLLPWYVAAGVDEEQRRQVESLLAEDGSARELEEVARVLYEATQQVSKDSPAPLHPQLLVEYAEDPNALDPDARRRIEAELRTDPLAEDLLDILRHLEPDDAEDAALPESGSGLATRVWSLLAASILRPVPALVYLLALLFVVPLLWLLPPASESPSFVLPHPVTLESDVLFRGTEPGAATPVELSGRSPLLLELTLDLSSAERTDPDLLLHVAVTRDAERLLERTRRVDDLIDGRLPVLLHLPGVPDVHGGATFAVRVTARRAGEPEPGVEIFRRTFRIGGTGTTEQ